MNKEQQKFYELSLSHSCLYSLLVKKGVITKDEFINHSELLRDQTIAMFKGQEHYEEYKELMTGIYKNIVDSAQ